MRFFIYILSAILCVFFLAEDKKTELHTNRTGNDRSPCALHPDSEMYGYKNGYVSSVDEERYQRVLEIVMVEKPPRTQPPLVKRIFDNELDSEFKTKYEQAFGFTAAERTYEAPNKFSTLEYNPGERVTVEEDQERKRDFAEYMVRRLSEHHIDDYLKNDPSARPVYELKQKVSNVRLQVSKGYDFKFKYSFSGNNLQVNLNNPYKLENRLVLQMESGGVGFTTPVDTYLEMRYPLSKSLYVGSSYSIEKEATRLSTEKWWSSRFMTSITATSISRSGYDAQGNFVEADDIFLVGFVFN